MGEAEDRCWVCRSRFRFEDAIGTFEGHVVHSRCLPRFTEELEEDDDDDAVKP